MARKALFFALLLGMVGILYWQGQILQSGRKSNGSTSNQVSQQITVNTNRNFLNVTQTFLHLESNREYKILIPNSISNWECVTKDGRKCPTNDTDTKTFRAQSGKLKIQFSIPLKYGSKTFLEKNWIMRLKNVHIQNTEIEVVDSVYRKGIWVASLPLKGSNKHEFIDYYVFEGTGENPSLYWQAKPLTLTNKNRYFSVYSQNKTSFRLSKAKLPNGPVYVVFIDSNEHPSVSVSSMVITNHELTAENVQNGWITSYFVHKFQRNSTNDWLVDVFTSLYLDIPAHTEKGILIVEQLNSQLMKPEIQKFIKSVLSQDVVQINELDQHLGELKGLNTHFFRSNNSQNFYSLTFIDNRQVKINEDTTSNLEVLRENEDLFFPFIKTMEELGYKVKENHDQNSVFLKMNNKQFLLYYNQSNFLYNGQKYGLLENPFRNVNGKIYINQKGIYTLFKVEISKSNREINLSN